MDNWGYPHDLGHLQMTGLLQPMMGERPQGLAITRFTPLLTGLMGATLKWEVESFLYGILFYVDIVGYNRVKWDKLINWYI